MRALTFTAFVVLSAAGSDSALAASGCGKGMLWPHVRQPGDCLTDDEIRAGQRGVYNGPINTNPDMSGVRVETPAQSSGVTGPSGPAAGPAPSPASAPPAANVTSGERPMVSGAGFTSPPVRAASGPCSKGWLWPFVRNPGDCLTDAEKSNGETGVYRSDQVVAGATPVVSPGVVGTSTQGGAPSSAGPEPAGSVVASAPACRKGWLWPFVRRAGDCPTDAERGRSRN
jgi:hypothetical protein